MHEMLLLLGVLVLVLEEVRGLELTLPSDGHRVRLMLLPGVAAGRMLLRQDMIKLLLLIRE